MQANSPESLDSLRTSDPTGEPSRSRIALIVPKQSVKKVKDALEAHGKLDKTVKIRPARLEELKVGFDGTPFQAPPESFLIPTGFSVGVRQAGSTSLPTKRDILRSLGVMEGQADVDVIAFEQARATYGLESERGCEHELNFLESSSMNPLGRTVCTWLHQIAADKTDRPFVKDIVLSYSWTYMIYPPLLLLPPSLLSNLSSIFASKGQGIPMDLDPLWHLLSKELKTSHIALNSPIPASVSSEPSVKGRRDPQANILRSPTGLAPMYGDFGPALPLTYVPTITDFTSAFWCTARQNGIFQTWAPRYTMFSRGNISEKTRILSLKAHTGIQFGGQPEETSAVDLYAGIGYFAFSYAKAGVGKVLCWEINPWSVEGLRRGAKKNGWGVKVIQDGQVIDESISDEERFIISQESNEHAPGTIATLRDKIPPVRHVNCGLLPSSKDSWEVAVQVLDRTGGWIHVHENIAKADIESRKVEVVEVFKRLLKNHLSQAHEVHWKVECEHVERVKSYAPGVMHCVLDIAVLLTG